MEAKPSLTSDVKDRFFADGLRDELDALANLRILVDGDIVAVQSQKVEVFHGGDLVGRGQAE